MEDENVTYGNTFEIEVVDMRPEPDPISGNGGAERLRQEVYDNSESMEENEGVRPELVQNPGISGEQEENPNSENNDGSGEGRQDLDQEISNEGNDIVIEEMDIVDNNSENNNDNNEDNDDNAFALVPFVNQQVDELAVVPVNPLANIINRSNSDRLAGALQWLQRYNQRDGRERMRMIHAFNLEPDDSGNEDNGVTEDFDTDLPGEHLYLGTMARVPGVDYLEINKLYRILVVAHYTLVFPGEILPMILPDSMFNDELQPEDGLLFGIIFLNMWEKTKPNLFGVTCQIFEKSVARHGCTCVKTRAHQRFIVTEKYNENFESLRSPNFPHNSYAYIFIQPELSLPDPLTDLDIGSMNRFSRNESMSRKVRHMQASTTPWPPFVYEQYNQSKIIEKAKSCLESYKIQSMPTDQVNLSFWLARNLLFDAEERINVFTTNYVNVRMRIMSKYLNDERCFLCRRCRQKIANCRALFAMSKHGVQTNYCNPCGFIHETNTVYEVDQFAVYPQGGESTAFSWFPGYSWQIILCRLCDIHIGWKFLATDPHLTPKSFYGLSGNNIEIQLTKDKVSNYLEAPPE